MTTNQILPIVLLVVALTGCSAEEAAIDDFSQNLTTYMTTPDEQSLEALTEIYVEMGYIGREGLLESEQDVRERRHRWWKLQAKAQRVLIHDEQWETLSTLYRNGISASDEAQALILSTYKGSDAELLEVMGWGAYHSGEIHQAYKAFEGAALAENSRAELLRGMAYHYGCADLYQIWGELTEYRRSFKGDAIPLSEPGISRRKLVEARMNLRKGRAPEIPEQCPIKPSTKNASS